MPTTLIGLVAEVVDAHDLVSAGIDDFDGNAATKLLDSYAGFGVVHPVGIRFFVGVAEDRRSTGWIGMSS